METQSYGTKMTVLTILEYTIDRQCERERALVDYNVTAVWRADLSNAIEVQWEMYGQACL